MTIDIFEYHLSQELLEKAISLEVIGIPRFVWHTSDALEIITTCREKGFIILGGDVLTISPTAKQTIEYTGDNWYYLPNESMGELEQAKASCDYAKAKVAFFSKAHGEESALFDLVIKDKL